MSWSANLLKKKYDRRIIGFDLRKNYMVSTDRIRATIDNQIWPQFDQIDDLISQCNGFNLFDQLDDSIRKMSLKKEALLVAFDMPLNLVNFLSSTFGLIPQLVEILRDDKEWHLVGFDVVDFRTQCSAIYSFDQSKLENEEVICNFSFQLNSYGLVQNELDAIDVACAFDKTVPDHSPFSPCGVWVKKKWGDGLGGRP
jgi:hypothetical protein